MATAIVCVMVASAFVGITMPAAADSEEPYKQIQVERGKTDLLGGGDSVFLKFGNWDAAFGIVWGTDKTPNNLYMMVMQARYIGMADAKEVNGNKIKDNIPMKIYTIYIVKLDNLLEFNDLNGNGIADFIRTGDGLNRTSIQPIEPIYKGVSLKTAWNASGEKSISDPANKSKSYEITISAKDQNYVKLNNSGNVTGVLDKLAFTFHLTARLVHVANATLPHFDVTVQQGMGGHRYDVVSAQRTGTVTVNGDVGKYAVKWDHLIEGWDFDPANTNKSLLPRVPGDRGQLRA